MNSTIQERHARRGTARDLGILIDLYARFDVIAKGELLNLAVISFGKKRMSVGSDNGPDDEAVHEWLTGLAKTTFPGRKHFAGELLELAWEQDTERRGMIFSDGVLAVALSPSEDEKSHGEALYQGYLYVRSISEASEQLPEPAEFFHINVPRDAFTELSENGWVFSAHAWDDEVQRQCQHQFESLVGRWRQDFFAALLSDGR